MQNYEFSWIEINNDINDRFLLFPLYIYIYPPRRNELFDPRYTHKLFPLSQGVPPLNEENKYVAKCGGYDEHRVEHGTIGAAGMATIARRRHRNDSARRERKI